MPKAEEMALKALKLDDQFAEAHAALASVRRSYWDWAEAEKEFKKAIELDPNSYEAHYGYAFLMAVMGRHDESIIEIKRAQQLDPLNPAARTAVASMYMYARRYDESIEQSQAALEIVPDFQLAYQRLAYTYEITGLYQEAAAAWQQEKILGGAGEEEMAGFLGAAATGKEAYWGWLLGYNQQRVERGDYISPVLFAILYAQLGERKQALESLEKAYLGRSSTLYFIKVDPRYDPIRDDPRFQNLLRRMNLAP